MWKMLGYKLANDIDRKIQLLGSINTLKKKLTNDQIIEVKNKSAQVEHEATTSKISDDQMFYCRQRGLDQENAISLIVNGFCKEVLKELPMEFAVEAQKLLDISLEGSIG